MFFFLLFFLFFLFSVNEVTNTNMAATKTSLPFQRHEIFEMTLEQLEQLNLESLGDLEFNSCDELTFKLAWQHRDQLRREADERKAAEWRARAKASTSHPEEESGDDDPLNNLTDAQRSMLALFTSERKIKVTKTSTSTVVVIE